MQKMDLDDFHSLGYLQEVNRRFFHPLGLAMGVVLDDSGHVIDVMIFDNRDDPEGIIFAELDRAKSEFIDKELASRCATRLERLGYVLQPLE